MLDTFDYWDRSLNSMSQPGERWCNHTARHLLQAIKTASLLRGGGRQLAEAVARSVAMVMSPAFQKSFLKHAATLGDEFLECELDVNVVLARKTLLNRYEFLLNDMS